MGHLLLFALVVGLQLTYSVCSWGVRKSCDTCKRRIIIEQITDPQYLTEAPHWDDIDQVLYFVDIPRQQLLRWNPRTKTVTRTFIKNGQLGVAVPVTGKNHTFVGGAGTDFVEITWDPQKSTRNPGIKVLATIDTDRKGTRFNDGKVDPKGRFWGGTMGIKLEPGLGSLYRFGPDNVPKRMVSPVSISNGLTWSLDNKIFYYIDSTARRVWAYDYENESGEISNRRTVFDFRTYGLPGIPDGMTIDTNGNLWVAIYDGGRVISINPRNGKLLSTVKLPAMQITSVAFGGRNFSVLFVTTARKNLDDVDLLFQPKAGAVFAIRGLGVAGRPMRRFDASV